MSLYDVKMIPEAGLLPGESAFAKHCPFKQILPALTRPFIKTAAGSFIYRYFLINILPDNRLMYESIYHSFLFCHF